MQPNVPSFIYRNWCVLKVSNGYLISGVVSEGYHPSAIPSGLITITDSVGNTISEIVISDENELVSNAIISCELTSGEILFSQSINYADVEEIDNPHIYWSKVRLSKFDTETEEIYWQQDYHADYEFIQGGARDFEPTPDGGAIILGGRLGWFFDAYMWMMKIDADGNEEWFHEYTYENCNTCYNMLYDIELAPDGGYVAAGYFYNLEVDARTNPWLLKVDACGDVEWQGCSPVGLAEKKPKAFSVYPNPSSGRFTVASDFNHAIASWAVYNLAGQRVAQGKTLNNENVEMNLNLPTGLYALELGLMDGRRENHKIQILK